MIVGYARVSTEGQSLDGQIEQLRKAGATTIYREKVSGARVDRKQLARMMAALREGDTIIVSKLDRLGRSTRELLNLLDAITTAGAKFRSIGDPAWNTDTPTGRLLSTLLAGIAEFERELIRERTSDGRKRAMANGVKFGRPRALDNFQQKEALRRRQAGEPLDLIAKTFRVSSKTVARL
jgi:DNA invertase Pin-like site-specific DNA recombinase